MEKIPSGISSYETIKTDNYYYIDKTKYMALEGDWKPALPYIIELKSIKPEFLKSKKK